MSAKIGDTVKVAYTGKLKDNTVFDSSDGEPLEFTLGEGVVIPGFEEAILGMDVGQHKTIELESDQAYGPHLDGLIATIDKNQFPSTVEPEAGKQIRVANQVGQVFVMTIVDVGDSTVTLDANHPLAGKDLVFDIDLVSIN